MTTLAPRHPRWSSRRSRRRSRRPLLCRGRYQRRAPCRGGRTRAGCSSCGVGADRRLRRGARVPLLAAYGLDSRMGERWVADWEQATGEDTANWQRLLERLQARGLAQTTGLGLIVHDGGSGLEAALDLVRFGPDVVRQLGVFTCCPTCGTRCWAGPGAGPSAPDDGGRGRLERCPRTCPPHALTPLGSQQSAATYRRGVVLMLGRAAR